MILTKRGTTKKFKNPCSREQLNTAWGLSCRPFKHQLEGLRKHVYFVFLSSSSCYVIIFHYYYFYSCFYFLISIFCFFLFLFVALQLNLSLSLLNHIFVHYFCFQLAISSYLNTLHSPLFSLL
jgi:hypothetical protein